MVSAHIKAQVKVTIHTIASISHIFWHVFTHIEFVGIRLKYVNYTKICHLCEIYLIILDACSTPAASTNIFINDMLW